MKTDELLKFPVAQEIIRDFNKIKNEKPLYHLTLNPEEGVSVDALKSQMIKQLDHFSRSFSLSKVNYLFVIEYPHSMIDDSPIITDRIGIHIHLVINTDIGADDIFNLKDDAPERLEGFFKTFWNCHMVIDSERIDDRTDRENLGYYLIKQANVINAKHYSFSLK